METQEQILKEQRLRIEVLRHQLLLRYYELLLSLDVLTQAAEVKTLMGYINTLERYAKRFENKPSKKEAGKKRRKNTADETTADDIHPRKAAAVRFQSNRTAFLCPQQMSSLNYTKFLSYISSLRA